MNNRSKSFWVFSHTQCLAIKSEIALTESWEQELYDDLLLEGSIDKQHLKFPVIWND